MLLTNTSFSTPSTKAQLVLLRQLTDLSGGTILHEAQIYHLKVWGLLTTDAKKLTVTWDPDLKLVDYVIERKTAKVPKNLGNRMQSLLEGVKFLLGDRWTIRVKLKGGRVLYDGTGTS